MTQEKLEQDVRQIPLTERLSRANEMIAQMCKQGRPPKMTIPIRWDDEDFYIGVTLRDAQAALLGAGVCTWIADPDGVYATACNQAFFFDSGNVAENNFNYCFGCGKKILARSHCQHCDTLTADESKASCDKCEMEGY